MKFLNDSLRLKELAHNFINVLASVAPIFTYHFRDALLKVGLPKFIKFELSGF